MRRGHRNLRSREIDGLIDFAQSWAPYGGAPEEEIFVQFGMTRARFAEVLWTRIFEAGYGPDSARHLANIYPPPSLINPGHLPGRPSNGTPERDGR